MDNLIINSICEKHSYRRLKGCLKADCPHPPLFCRDCSPTDECLHQSHPKKLLSYTKCLEKLSKGYVEVM